MTGAGMMDCKKALKETGGDVAAAEIFLKKKGMASADKKAGRTAAEGLVSSYIHAGSRIGVLLELNCETDFVARNPEFKELVDNFAMQIAASPNVEYVSVDDADQEFLAKEREIEMGKEDLQGKDSIKGARMDQKEQKDSGRKSRAEGDENTDDGNKRNE